MYTESATVHFSAHMFRQSALQGCAFTTLILLIPTLIVIIILIRLPFTLYTKVLPDKTPKNAIL